MALAKEIAILSATEILHLVHSGQLSPVEVVEACLERIQRYNDSINAVCTLSERALDQARAAQEKVSRGGEAGPLYGLTVGIKDVTPTAGLRTTYGSPLFADHIPEENALVVTRLQQAGAIVVGKTNAPEFAAGGHTFNAVFGATRNPWNPQLSAGGSTGGGAAALAAGMITLAEGTDLGGSLRIPASFCGVVGLRPSPGLVPTVPSEYLWDTIQVTGPMARTVEDVALMLQVMAGPSRQTPLWQPFSGRDFVAATRRGPRPQLRVAYCPDIAAIGIDPGLEDVCRRAAFELSQTGAVVDEVDLDLSFARDAFLSLRGLWMVSHHYRLLDRFDDLGDNLAGNIEAGLKLTTRQLGAAEQVRSRIWGIFRHLFSRFDQLMTPCMAVPPFAVEQPFPSTVAGTKMKTYVDWIAPTFVLSLSGLPVASVPCGLDPSGLPVGLQVVGPPQGEESVLAVAKQIQEAHPIGAPPLDRWLETTPPGS